MEAIGEKFAGGVLTALIVKIGSLLEQEYVLLAGVRRDVRFVRDELRSMDAFLHGLAGDADPQVQEWARQVRELAYDVEDSIDDFTRRVDRHHQPRGPDGFSAFLYRAAHLTKTLGCRRRIASEMQDLKARALDVSARRQRYNSGAAAGTASAVDPRLAALYADTASLVGIDGPRSELARWLARAGNAPQLKTVAVVGFGGLGKTTLAMEVYRKVGDAFDCRAFAAASQNLDMAKLLRALLSQVEANGDKGTETWEKERLINKLRECLQDKRYLIVIDDVWTIPAWENIKCALPKNNHGSRIMATTRINGVAMSCCPCLDDRVYRMKPLSDTDSEDLFFKRIFGARDRCPLHLEGVSRDILRKCGGVPLAINSIASLLATKPSTKEQWERVKNSVGSALEKDPNLEGMKQVLSLSYNDLPYYLKNCLLYLSIFPEDYKIRRFWLVRMWISEGSVHEEHGLRLEEVAEGYFYELINRSMIQPEGLKYDGRVTACRVHDIMLDLIKSKSKEENFVTLLCSQELESTLRHDKIRRLSIHRSDPDGEPMVTSMSLSHTRSLSMFLPILNFKPPFLKFKLLRVLHLEGCQGLEENDLKNICKLSLLKYMSLREVKGIGRLPAQIGDLGCLETLDLKRTGLSTLPVQISRLQRLANLLAVGIELPECVGKMMALQKLVGFNINKCSPCVMRDLGLLANLRKLRIWWYPPRTGIAEYENAVLSSLVKLGSSELQVLDFFSIYVCPIEFLALWSPPPLHLRRFRVRDCYLPRVPQWLGPLDNLVELLLWVHEVDSVAIQLLQNLLALRHLQLKLVSPQEERIIIGSAGFPCLKEFYFDCVVLCLTFEPEAMPKLERLELRFSACGAESYGVAHCGIVHIQNLEQLIVHVSHFNSTASDDEAVDAAMRSAVSAHPNHPKLSVH